DRPPSLGPGRANAAFPGKGGPERHTLCRLIVSGAPPPGLADAVFPVKAYLNPIFYPHRSPEPPGPRPADTAFSGKRWTRATYPMQTVVSGAPPPGLADAVFPVKAYLHPIFYPHRSPEPLGPRPADTAFSRKRWT